MSDTKKVDQNGKAKKMIPIFRIKPVNKTNSAIVKYIGSISENEKLGDEVIELDNPIHPDYKIVGRHAIPINGVGNFELTGRIFRCNIVGSHIVVSSRYPIMYLNVHYDRPMVSGSLFQIFFSIDMERAEKKAIKDTKQYLDLNFCGNWVRHIDCDDEFKQNYDKNIKEMLEAEAIEIVSKLDGLTDDKIIEEVDSYVNNERIYYDRIMMEQQMDFKSITKVRDEFVELCTSDRFYKFIKLSMKCREIHRRNEYGINEDDTHIVPTNITKLDDIKNQMLESGELILNNDD